MSEVTALNPRMPNGVKLTPINTCIQYGGSWVFGNALIFADFSYKLILLKLAKEVLNKYSPDGYIEQL